MVNYVLALIIQICCFRYTQVEIELINDPDLYLMIERGIRGGMSVITKKHVKANNTYTGNFDDGKPTTHCIYLDANNLYGWAMSEKMPYGNLRFLSHAEIEQLDVNDLDASGDTGYILEVDLDYPARLHDAHNELPVAPTTRCVSRDEWSPLTALLAQQVSYLPSGASNNPRKTHPKLIADLKRKTRYVVHYRNLQQYLKLGLVLVKIHRVVSFQQSHWLKRYIQLNTERRMKAKNAFEKDFFKLMNNSVFGKTMENVRKHVNVELVNCETRLARLSAKPNFERNILISDTLCAVKMLRPVVKLNKPIFIGFCILDLSKLLMYDFHYDVIKRRYREKAQLCFTDTDSLLYHIETPDVYKDMQEQLHLYDTSDYPKDHFLHSIENKKKLGKMKDEMSGVAIVEFAGLRAKMYSIKTCTGLEKKTAKGVSRSTIRHDLKHDMFVECVKSGKTTTCVNRSIRSFNHQVYSIRQEKLALCSFDDKRFVLQDGITTRAHGHYRNFSDGACSLHQTTGKDNNNDNDSDDDDESGDDDYDDFHADEENMDDDDK